MVTQTARLVALLAFSTGCAFAPSATAAPPSRSYAEKHRVAQADFEPPTEAELIQPPALAGIAEKVAAPDAPQRLPPAGGLTLMELERLAMGNNPAISKAAARVDAFRGKQVQVGLQANPLLGYFSAEAGDDGTAGKQGGFARQQLINAKKLQRNRSVVAAEIDQAQAQLAAMQQRVSTDVRARFYNALLAQRRVELGKQILDLANKAAAASQSLVEAEEIPLAGLLQTEIQQQNAEVLLRTFQNTLDQSWRQLAVITGSPDLPRQPLEGDVTQIPAALNWQQQLDRLQTSSPELAAAIANVERSRRALDRANIEPLPNVFSQVAVMHNNANGDDVANVIFGLTVPLWNRNQGGIRQAQAEVSEASRNVNQLRLDLGRRLADTYRDYANAHVTVETYAGKILPRSQKTFALVQRGYEQGEVGYLDLLTAQRTFSQTNLAYLDALSNLWQSYVRIDGLLLEGSLQQGSP